MLLESELKYFYHFISFWKVISSLRMKYPNSYNLHLQVSFCASQRLSFLWCASLDDSPIVHPSGFGHAQGNREVQERQARVLLYYWDTICIWQNSRRRQERSSTTKNRFGMTDSLSDHCLKYWVVSSFPMSSDMERGKVKETLLSGLLRFMLPITGV